MKFGFLKKKEPKLTRREIAARRQAEIYDDIPAQSYRRNRTLNSRQTASPMETSERLEAHRLIKKRRKASRRFFGAVCGLTVVLYLLSQLTINISVQTPDPKSSGNAAKYVKILNDYYASRLFFQRVI